MYTEVRYILDNGQEFKTQKDAEKALNKIYGDALTKLAVKICETGCKYSNIVNFLDNNLDMMREVIEARDEIERGLEAGSYSLNRPLL